MHRNIVFALMASLTLALLMVPVKPWVYQDESPEDQKFENFGPRANRLLIKLYPNEAAEWDALARGEIDIADWELSKSYHDLFTSNAINPATGLPYNQTINTVSYGADYSLYLLDINNNNNEFLGNPPDPAYPNPVYPNPCCVKQFRQAIAYLVDRSRLDTIIGKGLYTPLYTVVPSSLGSYTHPEIRPSGTLENLTYPYSRDAAETLLDLNGFPVNSSTGWRYWDRNRNNLEEPEEYLELKLYIRHSDPKRLAFGNFVADELNTVKVKVKRFYDNVLYPILDQVYVYKNFHIYTGGWNLDADPDYLILWNWNYYWHPGYCYNYASINNADFNTHSNGVLNADSLDEARTNAWLAQEVFASEALSVPLWSDAPSKAMSRIYTGGNKWAQVVPDDGENTYRGNYWDSAVNRVAYGIDDFHSFLNMHPHGYERGAEENMTIRWGLKTSTIESFNPLFAEWRWDQNMLWQIYDSLLMRNPYNPAEFLPWLAESFEIGTYNHPMYGECSKVKFTMRAEATWHDGTPITTADVYFTWVELRRILEARGMPDPIWWTLCPWQQPMVDFKIYDAYNFEMLFNVRSVWMLGWLSSTYILPKHVWKPIAETAPFEIINGPAPDPNMIGSGPWRLREYIENNHVLLLANKPGRTVQTNFAGSAPVTSPWGYWRFIPLNIDWRIDDSTFSKVSYGEKHTVSYTISNLYSGGSITVDVYNKVTYPNGTIIETAQSSIALNPAEQLGSNWTWTHTSTMKCKVRFDVNILVKSPSTFNGWLNTTKCLWATYLSALGVWETLGWPRMPEPDIVGSTFYDDVGLTTYPYKWQLPTPDFKTDVKDIAIVAKAFGTYPGHPRWNPFADINNDYKVNIKDIASIAKKFGWEGTP